MKPIRIGVISRFAGLMAISIAASVFGQTGIKLSSINQLPIVLLTSHVKAYGGDMSSLDLDKFLERCRLAMDFVESPIENPTPLYESQRDEYWDRLTNTALPRLKTALGQTGGSKKAEIRALISRIENPKAPSRFEFRGGHSTASKPSNGQWGREMLEEEGSKERFVLQPQLPREMMILRGRNIGG